MSFWSTISIFKHDQLEYLTINTHHRVCLVFQAWLKLINDHLAIFSGHICHLVK